MGIARPHPGSGSRQSEGSHGSRAPAVARSQRSAQAPRETPDELSTLNHRTVCLQSCERSQQSKGASRFSLSWLLRSRQRIRHALRLHFPHPHFSAVATVSKPRVRLSPRGALVLSSCARVSRPCDRVKSTAESLISFGSLGRCPSISNAGNRSAGFVWTGATFTSKISVDLQSIRSA